MGDKYTRAGAKHLVNLIESYWTHRGYPLIRAEAHELRDMPGLYGVRSNIGADGFPPRG